MTLPRATALNPLRCARAGMGAESLLVAKLSWLLLLLGGFLGHVGRPYVPWFESLDALRTVPGIGLVLPGMFILAGLALLTNQFARVAAVLAGACVLLAPALSLAAWRSHEWVAGCLLVVAGLQPPGDRPILLRVQVTLIALAVLFDDPAAADWSRRITLEGWTAEQGSQPVLQVLRDTLPGYMLRTVTGWFVPALAVGLAAAVWVPSIRNHAIWCACAAHLGGYVLIGSKDTALYITAVLIGYLAFLNWPRESLVAHWPRACGWPVWLRIALTRQDHDRQIEWPFPDNPDADLDVWVDGRHCFHRKGISALLLYCPAFHFLVFGIVLAIYFALPEPWSMLAHACVGGWLLVFFALPTFARVSRRWRRA